MARLPATERRSRLLTRRSNACLAAVEAFVRGTDRDPVKLARAMRAYVDALDAGKRRKPTIPALDPDKILRPEIARAIFGPICTGR